MVESNFFKFISVQENNLLASIHNQRKEFDLFSKLDFIYKRPWGRVEVKRSEVLIPALYGYVNNQLYLAIAAILRVHISQALSETRIAIDGTLTAYKIIESPETGSDYLNESHYFKKIKYNIEKERKDDERKFPLAQRILKFHDSCSQFGSHADVGSFVHRYEQEDSGVEGKEFVKINFFQIPENEDTFAYYFTVILVIFFQMFRIFKEYFDGTFKIEDSEWEYAILALAKNLEEHENYLDSRTNTS